MGGKGGGPDGARRRAVPKADGALRRGDGIAECRPPRAAAKDGNLLFGAFHAAAVFRRV